jgi:dolichol-phosphate mannosyltransferase
MGHASPLDRSLLSVVVPIYNERDSLPQLVHRLREAVDGLGFDDHELILVSDGSTDGSESLIRQYADSDPQIVGVFLTRNFGHQAAISTGLEHARGSVVGVIDGDLQDPPEAIGRLIDALDAGADVAYGVRARRKEGWAKRAAYYGFYRLLRWVAAIEIPLDSGDFCCMRRRVVEAVRELPERRRFVRGLRAWVGFDQRGVAYERAARYAATPRFTLGKLMGLAYDGLFSFTSLPVRVIQGAGFIVAILALVVALGYLVWYLVDPAAFAPRGFASLIISIWFFAGVQLLCLGIIGEYVVRACDESRGRPVSIVREVVGIRPGALGRRVRGGRHPRGAAIAGAHIPMPASRQGH